MTIRELIQAEINQLPEESLEDVYRLLKRFTQARQQQTQSLMSKLKSIKIDALEDFSTDYGLYIAGKRVTS
ncbi:hypothetical protein NDA01_20875 [Trichocoleus desertorum AS-A10]|uniref:hypothetical protein n=1 Tax=Trichocoleus desertorum TaxID=1481672 RepID=UPI0032994216